ncbi:hypothetical protein H0H93_013127, partial [Arthromyces matolae]
EMQKMGPSRAQLLAAVEGVESPSEEWWKSQSPCLKCGRNGDCIPHWSKNSKRSTLTSCKLCHIKRVPCSLKIDWQISELVRLHPEWPGWWIVEKEREGWLKKTRGAKVESGAGSSSKVPSKGKGKRKAQSEEEEEESNWQSSSPDADGDSDPDAVVELVTRPTKRPRIMEYRPYSKPPGPTALPGCSIAKTLPPKPSSSKVGGVFVLVPPLTVPQPSDRALRDVVPSNPKIPLFAPSETPEVAITSPPAGPVPDPAPKFIPDPKSPLTIRVRPNPPPLRAPSPPPRQVPAPSSPGFEIRDQVHQGIVFSRGDVLRARVAESRRTSLIYAQQLFQAYAIASMRATQLDVVRRELQENNVVLSPLANFCLNEVIESSRLSVVQSAFTMGSRVSVRLRRALAGGEIPSEQELIDAMDEEGADE